VLKTKVKASQISNLTDARYFAAWYSKWLGFCCDTSSPDYVTPELLHAIRDWVEGPQIVGEFGAQDAKYIREAVDFLKLDAVQVGFFYDQSKLEDLKDLTLIREVVIDPNEVIDIPTMLEAMSPYVQCFILEFGKNNISWTAIQEGAIASHALDVNTLKELCKKHSILLSINVKGEEVNKVLETIQPYGLNVFGGEEEKVGFKSFDELDEIFEALED